MLKSFVNAGIPLALGSDGGVAEQNPFLNLMLAVLVPSGVGPRAGRSVTARPRGVAPLKGARAGPTAPDLGGSYIGWHDPPT